ncbi:hypothetical protein H5410_004481 [Solanum commersonii]|uniref:Uncharacterized protein n=1 Tax=Solanum commersonii TaxID=4109 RepID=A0A9J6B883_SOLCO|nr:hypothetical protein H5410_004481 [Solanum commersonii]
MGNYEQRRVKEHLGHLVDLMEIDPRRDVIEALIPLWDPTNSAVSWEKGLVFGGADLRNKRPIIPKNVDAKKFLDLLKINQTEKESLKNGCVSLDFLYERYGQNEGFKKYHNQLSNQGGVEAWKVNGCLAFMATFFRLIIFPKREKHIDIHLAGVVKALTIMESPTIIPMILTYMFHALAKCKNGKTYFEGCNILLQT